MSARTVAAATDSRAPATTASNAGMAMLKQYWPQMQHMLPSHVRKEAWYSAVFAALYRGQDSTKDLDLWRAAERNPESLIFALFDAARQGLEPGTPQYYLTPRPNRKARAGVEVLGIRGYQGEIELIYRAGAAASVVTDVVRARDQYRYVRGVDQVPHHQYDPFASEEDRGPVRGAYAYAIMTTGAVSQVVQIGPAEIARAMQASPTAKSEYSPWQTDYAAMVLKTSVHRLAKFVPTSAEYRHVVTATATPATPPAISATRPEALAAVGQVAALPAATGNGEPPAVLDESRFAQPPAPEDEQGSVQPEPAAGAAMRPSVQMLTEFPPVTGSGDDPPASRAVQTTIARVLAKVGVTSDADRYAIAARLAGRAQPVKSTAELSAGEGKQVVVLLTGWQDAGILDQQIAAIRAALAETPDAAPPLPEPGTAGAMPDPETDPEGWHQDGHPRPSSDGSVTRTLALPADVCQWCAP